MAVVRVTKEFSFEMAHALPGYDGLCREIHGHSYRLFVTVKGTPSENPADPKFGMVMDFGELKKTVNRLIVDRYDHTLLIRAGGDNAAAIAVLKKDFARVEAVDYQPTCENMAIRFAEALRRELPEGVELHGLKLYETATSYAEWLAEDNGRV